MRPRRRNRMRRLGHPVPRRARPLSRALPSRHGSFRSRHCHFQPSVGKGGSEGRRAHAVRTVQDNPCTRHAAQGECGHGQARWTILGRAFDDRVHRRRAGCWLPGCECGKRRERGKGSDSAIARVDAGLVAPASEPRAGKRARARNYRWRRRGVSETLGKGCIGGTSGDGCAGPE